MKIIDYINGKEASEYSEKELLKSRTELTNRVMESFGYKKSPTNLADSKAQ